MCEKSWGKEVYGENLCDQMGMGSERKGSPLWGSYYRTGNETWGLVDLRNSSDVFCFVLFYVYV